MKSNNSLKLFYIIIIFLYGTKSLETEVIIMNIYYSEESGNYTTNISSVRDEYAVASAIYNKTYEKIGWDYLSISSYEKNDSKYNDSMKAYAMGYLEGVLTKDRIYDHYVNFEKYFLSRYNSQPQAISAFYKIMLDNINYMKKKALEHMEVDPYWEHVYYVYQQILGLYEGYISVADEEKQLEFSVIITLSGCSDAKDIVTSLMRQMYQIRSFKEMTPEEIEEYELYNSHCSAFIKLTNDYNDILFGHNTWNYYIFMIRIFKEYRFVTNKGNEKSKSIAFSSYPAALSSIDEFYVMDSNLLMMGTSINIIKDELYDLFTYESILIWVRQIVANRLSSSGQEWTNYFKRENSGTNNEQVMILDMNKIHLKNKTIDDEALMIIEQMPKYTETVDVTDHLRNGYWPSYNVPFVDKIYKDMGNTVENNENIKYTQSPRALIFKRDQGKINTKEEFKKFMRYNDYLNDELSLGIPSKTIAAREDLKSGTSATCHGAIDVKFVSVKDLLEKKNLIYIISGPTNDQQKTFSWSNNTCISDKSLLSWKGHNDVWNFPWIDYNIQLFHNKDEPITDGPITDETTTEGPITDGPKTDGQEKEDKSYIYWIIGVAAFLILIAIVVLFVVYKKKSNKEYSTESEDKETMLKDVNEKN